MTRTTIRFIGTLAAALAVTGLASSVSMASQDLRSPDAREAALSGGAVSGQDLRSPDAVDAAQPPAASPSAEPSGSWWADVAIVAGGAIAMVLIGFVALSVIRQRRTVRKARVPVVSS